MAEQERCGTCRFWFIFPDDDDMAPGEKQFQGHCHRFPPLAQAHIAEVQGHAYVCYNGHWLLRPEVMDDDWCGEYQPQEEQ